MLDYDYDATGQMTRQRDEQGQRYLTYDVSGKVTGVYRDAGQTQPLVTYGYDDRGFRARKASYSPTNTLTKTTYYVRDLAGNVLSTYEQAAGASLLQTEVPLYGSGRVGTRTRLDDGTRDARYELNDQLGNARVIFHQPTTTAYTASMEDTQLSADEEQFQHLSSPRVADGAAWSGTRVTAVTGNTPGPAKQLTVEKGNTITFSAMVKGFATAGAAAKGPQLAAYAVAGSRLATPLPPRPEADGRPVPAGGFAQTLRRVAVGFSITGLLKAHTRSQAAVASATQGTEGAAIAYLHYRFYDANGDLKAESDQELSGASWQEIKLGFRVPEAGRVELSSGVRTPGGQVSFDDVRYEQTGSLIVQEQHQYAYGSPLTGLSYVVGNKRYRHGYQGQYAKQDEETGYESFELRLYDSRIGRWLSTDPEGQFDSPFVGMGNNPVSGVDPDGGLSGPGDIITTAGLAKGATITGYSFSRLASRAVTIASGIGSAYIGSVVNFWKGAGRGLEDTGSYFGGLTPLGSNPSWQQTGNSLLTTAMTISPNPIFNNFKMQSSQAAISYAQELPNKRSDEIFNDLGYGAEKLTEMFLIEKASFASKAAAGMPISKGASPYYSRISYELLYKSSLGKMRLPFRVPAPYMRGGRVIMSNNAGIITGKWLTIGTRAILWPSIGQYFPNQTGGATGSW